MGLFSEKVNGYVIKPGADLNGADLTDTNVDRVTLTDANLTAVKW